MDTSSLKARYEKSGMFVPNYDLPQRNYIEINLDGDVSQDKVKLDFAQIRIREINSLGDTLNGIHFSFGDSCQYWAYVKAIDILLSCNATYWLPVDDDIWFYHRPFRSSGCDVIISYVNEELSLLEKTEKYIFNIWYSSWHLIIGFIGFLFTIFYLKTRLNSS